MVRGWYGGGAGVVRGWYGGGTEVAHSACGAAGIRRAHARNGHKQVKPKSRIRGFAVVSVVVLPRDGVVAEMPCLTTKQLATPQMTHR